MPAPDFRPGSDEEWAALLRQLRQQPQAQPQPFFYARVQARLLTQAAARRRWLPARLRRPAYVALLSAMVLAISGDGPVAAPAHPGHRGSLPAYRLPH